MLSKINLIKMNHLTKMKISNSKSKTKHFSASLYDGNFEMLLILLPCSYRYLVEQRKLAKLFCYLQNQPQVFHDSKFRMFIFLFIGFFLIQLNLSRMNRLQMVRFLKVSNFFVFIFIIIYKLDYLFLSLQQFRKMYFITFNLFLTYSKYVLFLQN